ncbi:ribonuclease H-like domain-containing protein [Tanacetum coccineum]|uniref:Ribonuclease H-like domain-containing protein n=1 Tax=Tanacetum coccineum TaxID=301880 RepID=A0ABQ4WJX7_9ASTR
MKGCDEAKRRIEKVESQLSWMAAETPRGCNGTLSRYTTRLVANGCTQLEGVDVDETFSPVVKPGAIGTVITSSQALLQQIITSLHQEFSMTDLGSLNYFLGIYVTQDSSGMFLSHKKYVVEILERAHIVNYNHSRTPIDTKSKLGYDGDLVSDPTLYRSLAGTLQYLAFTRPNISYAVQQIWSYMHNPREPHLSALKRILRYVRGTLDYRLQLFSSSTIDLVAYLDIDWASCPTTRRRLSITVFPCKNLLSAPLSVSRRFLVLVRRQSIVVLPMLLLRLVGCEIYYVSCVDPT